MSRSNARDDRGLRRPDRPDPWERRAAPLALLLLFALLLQGLAFIGESSQTSDEGAHLAAGYSYLKTGDFRLNVEHPPLIKELAAAPLLGLDLAFPWGPLWDDAEEWNIGRIFVHENRVPNDTILFLARLPMLGLSLLLGWAIFRWARRLFGPGGALLSLGLYAFDPNVVAHSCLVTTDLGVTLFIFLAVYALWCWAERPVPRTLGLAGLALGGAFASKFTALWLLPIFAALGVVLILTGAPLPRRPWTARSATAGADAPARARILSFAAATLVIAGIACLVVLACYAGTGLPAFARGLQTGLSHSSKGHVAYLMGRLSDSGWWYYFLFAFLVKTPIGTLAAVLLAIAACGAGRRLATRTELFLFVPILVVVAITCFWKVNIGLRHLLPIYPFLYVAAGRIAAPHLGGVPWGRLGRALPVAAALCIGSDVVEALRIAPHDLAYFNAFVGGPENGHRYLLDSNLDWGQSAKALRRYLGSVRVPTIYLAFAGNSDPWYYGVSYQYLPGSGNLDNAWSRPIRVPDEAPRELLAISPMVLHSVHFNDHHLYDWLLAKTPIARPGETYFVYDITREPRSHAAISVLCLSFGLLDLADFEARRTLRLDPGNVYALAVLDKLREIEATGRPPGGPVHR